MSTYSTRARLDLLIGLSRVESLLDRNQDGLEDVGVADDAISRASNRIDALLSRSYPVPFSSQPSTPGVIADVCDYLAAAHLYETAVAIEIEEVKKYLALADSILNPIIMGNADVPGVERLGSADGQISASGAYASQTYSGVCLTSGGVYVARSGRLF
jgi:phage gp36-like protein